MAESNGYSTAIIRQNHVVSTWNPRGVFVGKLRQRTAGGISEGAKTSDSKLKLKKKLKVISNICNSKNILNLILCALVGRARRKICKISIYQIFLDDWKRPF